jgi:hypothetical protein
MSGIPIVQATEYNQYQQHSSAAQQTHPQSYDYTSAGGPLDAGKIYSPEELRQHRQDPPKKYHVRTSLFLTAMRCSFP